MAFSELRLKLIVFAQGFTILIVPVIAFILLRITNSKSIMKEYKNSLPMRIIGTTGVLLLVSLAVIYIYFIYL